MEPTDIISKAAPEAAKTSSRLWDILPDSTPFGELFSINTVILIARVAISVVLGLILVGLVVSILKKFTKKRLDARSGGLVVKLAQYLGFAFIAINALDAANVNLSALLGAAGIAGVAIGFAAQTSVSNFISGFFIVSEKTFVLGDVISIDGTSGLVYSIDAMSVKLRTFDNQLIRIPNETLIKANVSNITRFPVRRLNMNILFTYDCDLERIKTVLMDIATKSPNALKNPEPAFMVTGFKDSGVGVFFGVWYATNEWFDGNNDMYIAVKKRLDAEGIEFAFPTMTIYPKPVTGDTSTKTAKPRSRLLAKKV
ncbi:MAG: mechanosensitive ion channel family protein [Spirochaetia bacterium]|jgi:small-conductance mechanosensitive channel|nr:mechanosensitive ion channel family protein [Spirochaetia bacterium]